jgi:hypothetical protein
MLNVMLCVWHTVRARLFISVRPRVLVIATPPRRSRARSSLALSLVLIPTLAVMQLPLGALALVALGLRVLGASAPAFENTAIVRTVELGGALARASTTFAARALAPNTRTYVLALPAREAARTRFIEAGLKGAKTKLPLVRAADDADG